MGCGDWNDGMNLVGEHGKGESVWLAFFLYDVLVQFEPLARRRQDAAFADLCAAEAAKLRQNIEQHAWDGEWYRRAYFDNGEPMGSASSPECKIDSLPQSWSVLSGAGDPARSRQALDALDAHLVKRDLGVIQLFDPPFDKSHLNPGYIKGYVPGVRENGGQYTHAAVWAVMAFAAAGDNARAWELFRLINPVRHGDSEAAIATYKVEPYVVAADVYTNPQHAGRGGWTWYTGSAGWMYRLITESLLGLRLEVDRLRIEPVFPDEWESFDVHYRYRETFHHIHVRNLGRAGGRATRSRASSSTASSNRTRRSACRTTARSTGWKWKSAGLKRRSAVAGCPAPGSCLQSSLCRCAGSKLLAEAGELLKTRLSFAEFLAKLPPKDRVNAEKRVGVLEASAAAGLADLWRRLASALMTLSPHAAKLVGKQTVQFYVADGKYRMQVFALEDLQDQIITVYCPDVLTEAIGGRPARAADRRPDGRVRDRRVAGRTAHRRVGPGFGKPRRPLQGHGRVEPDGGAYHTAAERLGGTGRGGRDDLRNRRATLRAAGGDERPPIGVPADPQNRNSGQTR